MILKVKVDYNDKDWWILDDIRRVVVSHSNVLKKEEFLKKSAEFGISLISHEGEELIHFVKLGCRRSNGEEFSVIFDTVAYLCNDEGKTIEKIIVV